MKAILIFTCICIVAMMCGYAGMKDRTSQEHSAGTSRTVHHRIDLRHPNHPNSSSKFFQWDLDAWHYRTRDTNPFRLRVGPNRTVEWRMEDGTPDFAIIVLDTSHWVPPAGGWRTDILPPFNCSTCGGVISTTGSVTLTFKGPANTHYEIVVPGSIFGTKDNANTQTNDMVDATIVYDPTDNLKNPK